MKTPESPTMNRASGSRAAHGSAAGPMTEAEADKLYEQVQRMSVRQLSKLWQWIYLEMGGKIEHAAHCCQKCGMPGATMHWPGGLLCAGGCKPPNCDYQTPVR